MLFLDFVPLKLQCPILPSYSPCPQGEDAAQTFVVTARSSGSASPEESKTWHRSSMVLRMRRFRSIEGSVEVRERPKKENIEEEKEKERAALPTARKKSGKKGRRVIIAVAATASTPLPTARHRTKLSSPGSQDMTCDYKHTSSWGCSTCRELLKSSPSFKPRRGAAQ